MPAGRPRVIRKPVRLDGKKRPKVARDRNLGLLLERVHAREGHRCANDQCSGVISAGLDYVQLTYLNHLTGPFIRGRRLPAPPLKLHTACVPPEARPLIRLVDLPVPTSYTASEPTT